MKLLNIGFGNMVSAERLIAVVPTARRSSVLFRSRASAAC